MVLVLDSYLTTHLSNRCPDFCSVWLTQVYLIYRKTLYTTISTRNGRDWLITLCRSSMARTILAAKKHADFSASDEWRRSSKGPDNTEFNTSATLSLSIGVAKRWGTNGDGLNCLKRDLSNRTWFSRPSLCTFRRWYLFMLTMSPEIVSQA